MTITSDRLISFVGRAIVMRSRAIVIMTSDGRNISDRLKAEDGQNSFDKLKVERL